MLRASSKLSCFACVVHVRVFCLIVFLGGLSLGDLLFISSNFLVVYFCCCCFCCCRRHCCRFSSSFFSNFPLRVFSLGSPLFCCIFSRCSWLLSCDQLATLVYLLSFSSFGCFLLLLLQFYCSPFSSSGWTDLQTSMFYLHFRPQKV